MNNTKSYAENPLTTVLGNLFITLNLISAAFAGSIFRSLELYLSWNFHNAGLFLLAVALLFFFNGIFKSLFMEIETRDKVDYCLPCAGITGIAALVFLSVGYFV